MRACTWRHSATVPAAPVPAPVASAAAAWTVPVADAWAAAASTASVSAAIQFGHAHARQARVEARAHALRVSQSVSYALCAAAEVAQLPLARGDGEAGGRMLAGRPAVVPPHGKGIDEIGREVGVALERRFRCFCRYAAAAAAAAIGPGKGRRNGRHGANRALLPARQPIVMREVAASDVDVDVEGEEKDTLVNGALGREG